MTESIEPHRILQQELDDIENREVNSAFDAIMQQEFPNDIQLAHNDQPYEPSESLSGPEAVGSDVAIARAHIEDLRQLVVETQKRQADLQAELDRQIHERLTSKLTGMPNREAFVGWLDQEIASKPSQKLTVGFLDMDKLKTINDTYGHELADEVIRRIGEILSSGVRSGEDMIAAHRSGDEFLIGINGANPERIKDFANSTLHAINRLHIRKNPDGNSEIVEINPEDTSIDRNGLHQVGASMGFAGMRKGMDASRLMTAADQAMYQAKEAGRNHIIISEA